MFYFCGGGANRSPSALVIHPSVDTASRHVNVNNLLNVDFSRRKHSSIGSVVRKTISS